MYLYMEDATFAHQFIDGGDHVVDVLVKVADRTLLHKDRLPYCRIALDLAPACSGGIWHIAHPWPAARHGANRHHEFTRGAFP